MLPANLNQRILQLISEAYFPITLGLLPLTASEETECIDQVVSYCEGKFGKLIDLLRLLTPAAAAYAIAAGASQAVQEGKKFWMPLSEKLRIDFDDPQDRKLLSDCYSATCRRLGVVNPDVSAFAWGHIAPMMAQASILHSWTDALANGLQVTLKHHPPPDLEDPAALRRFAFDLASRIHHQGNLQKVLETEVGGVVVHRLISSCVYDRFELLPAHLIGPIKDALAGSGRQASLKSPYVSFSTIHSCFELVLPKQSDRLATHSTYWLINGIQYAASFEHRLSEFEIGNGEFRVTLCNLGAGYPNQPFNLNVGLNGPFRVFDEVSLRERHVQFGTDTVLAPGEYLVVMQPECSTNDPGNEELRGKYRLLSGLSLRPGLDPLNIFHGGSESSLTPALRAGIYHSSEGGSSTVLRNGLRLHYGSVFGLLAYIPKNQHDGNLNIQVSSRDSILLSQALELESQETGVYDYTEALEVAFQEAVLKLGSGIYPLRIEIEGCSTSVTRDLWYWKGLERINQHLGFFCNKPPCNIVFERSKGIAPAPEGCRFISEYFGPRIVIALQGGDSIEIPRSGVQSFCLDQANDWQTELRANEMLTLGINETRVIRFEAGGFDRWSVRCNGQEIATLDQNRVQTHVGLASLLVDYGKSGVVEAHSADGAVYPLFSFASALLAHNLELELDHGRGLNIWRTRIPTDGIGCLGILVQDYTNSPEPTASPVIELFQQGEFEHELDIPVRDGVHAFVRFIKADTTSPDRVKLCLEVAPARIPNGLLLLQFVYLPIGSQSWHPLSCVDGPSVSQLCIVQSGDGVVDSESSLGWWQHVWRVNKSRFTEDSVALYGAISEGELEGALKAISHLTAIKFPASVYQHSAKYCSSLAHKIWERRMMSGSSDDDVWWKSAGEELEAHAFAKVAPVVRQFLFSCNPNVLRRVWTPDSGPGLSTGGLVTASLDLVRQVIRVGGRVNYASSVFHLNRHPQELFTSFRNAGLVFTGQAEDFASFDYGQFFKEMFERALQHQEESILDDDAPVLSAHQLCLSIRALNRRTRILTRASNSEREHPLSNTLQALTSTHKRVEGIIRELNQSIGYQPLDRRASLGRLEHYDPTYFPDLPSLGSVEAKRLADLTWALCVLTRASAHGHVSSNAFQTNLKLFIGSTVQTHPINLIFSFGPELFAYYVALLDFTLYRNPIVAKP